MVTMARIALMAALLGSLLAFELGGAAGGGDLAGADVVSAGGAAGGAAGGGDLAGADDAAAVRFDWPLAPPVEIVRAFDLPAQPWLAGHRGVDLRAPAGAAVLAPAAGAVSFNGWIVDRHVLVIRHGELASTLEPVLSDLAVGAVVARGEAVGAVAAGEAWHCQDCLHWGVRRQEQYLDPTLLVNPQPRAVLWR